MDEWEIVHGEDIGSKTVLRIEAHMFTCQQSSEDFITITSEDSPQRRKLLVGLQNTQAR